MLTIYEQYEEFIDSSRINMPVLRYQAGDLAEAYGFKDKEELEHALNQAFDACFAMDIPLHLHFRKIYIHEQDGIKTDWLLSTLGSYLLLISGNSSNPWVARARLYFFSKKAED